jgi:predicted transcriptional regulator
VIRFRSFELSESDRTYAIQNAIDNMLSCMIHSHTVQAIMGVIHMGTSRLSVTVPDDIFAEIRNIAERRKSKLSKVVTEAIAEKIGRIKEEEFIARINKFYDDPVVGEEQRSMGEDIASSMDVEELPW